MLPPTVILLGHDGSLPQQNPYSLMSAPPLEVIWPLKVAVFWSMLLALAVAAVGGVTAALVVNEIGLPLDEPSEFRA